MITVRINAENKAHEHNIIIKSSTFIWNPDSPKKFILPKKYIKKAEEKI